MKQMTEQQRLCLQALSGLPPKAQATIIVMNNKSAIPLTAVVVRTNLRVLAKEGYCTEEEGGGFTITPAGEAAVQEMSGLKVGPTPVGGRRCDTCLSHKVCYKLRDQQQTELAILSSAKDTAEKAGFPSTIIREFSFDWPVMAELCEQYLPPCTVEDAAAKPA